MSEWIAITVSVFLIVLYLVEREPQERIGYNPPPENPPARPKPTPAPPEKAMTKSIV